jgi:NTP pyrophosphatase (non-canonical NTP hydrolase)
MKGSLIDELTERVVRFREVREWKKYHTPKNLASSIAVEAAELLEIFQWSENGYDVVEVRKGKIAEEVADIFIYLLLFCHECGIDIINAFNRKMEVNESKYPVEKAKGRSSKYTELK